MASNSNRRSSSSARSTNRRRVVIGARETVRVRYADGKPSVEKSERRKSDRQPKSPGQRFSDTKKQDRERRARSIRRRRVLLVGLLASLIAAVVWGVSWLWHSPVFAITSVAVEGASRVARSDISSAAAVPSGATLLDVDRDAVAVGITKLPWIASAEVERDFPHTLVIRVTERTPAAVVTAADRSVWIVSADAYWLQPRAKEDTTSLVPITDLEGLKPVAGEKVASPEVVNALAVMKGISAQLRRQIVRVVAPTVDKTALITKSGVQVFVGEATDIAKKDAVVRRLLKQQKGKIVYINVRTPDRPTWRGIESTP